jgi:hypothetical protein
MRVKLPHAGVSYGERSWRSRSFTLAYGSVTERGRTGRRRARTPSGFFITWQAVACVRLDTADRPHVVYGLDHLYYTWPDGAGWHSETVDGSKGVGINAALALDGEGHPHICYFDKSELVLTRSATANRQYSVRTCPSLLLWPTWSPLAGSTNLPGSNGTMSATDTGTAAAPTRSYQLVAEPEPSTVPPPSGREGPKWEHLYHCTRIQDGRHLLTCSTASGVWT